MKVSLIILVSLCALAASSDTVKSHYSPEYLKGLWEDWKEDFDWDCGTESEEECQKEEEKRFNIFLETLQKVETCNQDPNTTHTCGLGQFAHLTLEEFLEQYTGSIPEDSDSGDRLLSEAPRELTATCTEMDWEKAGKVTPVKNQQTCGSCWSFAATGNMESCQAIADCTTPVSLSEEQLLECISGKTCQSGGNPGTGMNYAVSSGMMSESEYPYVLYDSPCEYDSTKVVQQPVSRVRAPHSNADAQKAILCNSTIAVTIQADTLQTYESGIISNCKWTNNANHAVLLVGFNNTENSFRLKNSWGTTWGEEGYYRVTQTDNTDGYGQCGMFWDTKYTTCAPSSNSQC